VPAVAANPITLARVPHMPPEPTRWRPVRTVVSAQRQLEGEGFVVRRPFPSIALPAADPFLLLDQMGEVEYAPGEAKGALGLPTVRR
jgi:hypothetical protein